MFADPQSVTVNAVAKSLPAIARGEASSTYRIDDGSLKLTIGHDWKKRNRVTVRLDGQKTAPDPLSSANNVIYTMSAYVVIDSPTVGYTNAELKDIALALTGWCTSSNLLKVLGGET